MRRIARSSRCGSAAWAKCSATDKQQHPRLLQGRIADPVRGAGRKAARARLAWLDGDLGGRRFLAGERYTIADITALCAIDFGRVVDIRIAPEQKNLMRWYGSVSSRPSAKA
jgi:glutathione S-transferase